MSFPIKIGSGAGSLQIQLPRANVTSFILQGGTLAESVRYTLSQNLPLTLVQRILIGDDIEIVRELERELNMPVTGNLNIFVTNYPIFCYTKNWRNYHSTHECISMMVADGQLDELKTYAKVLKRIHFETHHLITAARRGYHEILTFVLENSKKYDVRIIEAYASINNIEPIRDLNMTSRHIWQLLMGAAAGGHIRLFTTYKPLYVVTKGRLISNIGITTIIGWALRHGQNDMVAYLLKSFDYPVGYRSWDRMVFLENGFLSGRRSTVAYVLTITNVKVTSRYLKHIAGGGNFEIIKEYREYFGEEVFHSELQGMIEEAFTYQRHHMVWYLVTTTDFSDWNGLLKDAISNYSIPLVRLCLDRGVTNIDERLEQAKLNNKLAIVRLLEDFQRQV